MHLVSHLLSSNNGTVTKQQCWFLNSSNERQIWLAHSHSDWHFSKRKQIINKQLVNADQCETARCSPGSDMSHFGSSRRGTLIFHLSASHKCPLKLSLLTYRWWIIFNYKTYLYKKKKEQSLKRKKQQSHSSLKAEHYEACDNSPHRKAFQAGWFSAVILRSVISTPFLCWASNPCSHHAAFHSGNHEWSLWGLKQSFGDWMQPGNQPQLEEGWCKTATSAPWDILFTTASGSPFFSTSFPHSGDCCNLSLSARTF